MSSLLPVFEEFLKNAPQDASYDSVRQSVVILMGSLAKHLDKNDPKVKPIVAKLITALSTPSQQVSSSSSFTPHTVLFSVPHCFYTDSPLLFIQSVPELEKTQCNMITMI